MNFKTVSGLAYGMKLRLACKSFHTSCRKKKEDWSLHTFLAVPSPIAGIDTFTEDLSLADRAQALVAAG